MPVAAKASSQIEPAQHLRNVSAKDDAGADARKTRRLLIDRDLEAGALQQPRHRQSGETRAENGDPCSAIHLSPSFQRRHSVRAADYSIANDFV